MAPNRANLSVSPDGHWLLYQRAYGEAGIPDYMFYDLAVEAPKQVSFSDELAELVVQYGVRDGAFWRQDGSVVLALGDGTQALSANPGDAQPSWKPVSGVWAARRASRGASRIEVSGQHTRRVVILNTRMGEEREVAVHRAGVRGNLVVENPATSPGGSHVAYSLSMGQTWVGPTQGIVASMSEESPPRLLAAPVVGPLVWGPTATGLFGVSRCSEGEWGIYRWRVEGR